MSIFARTPESYAAWHQVKRNVALRPDAPQRARSDEGSRELQLLFSELQELPTPEALERFCALSTELAGRAERSFLRSSERQRCQDMCIADLQAGIEDYRRLFNEHLRLVDFVHQQQVLALQKEAELERRKRLYAENEVLKAAREIQLRRDRERGGGASHGRHSTMVGQI